MTWTRALLAIALLGGALLADDKPAKCDLCGGRKEVKCFCCDGKGAKTPCSTCGGGGRLKCPACGGAGQFVCPICGGAGFFGGVHGCKTCKTHGKFPCTHCQGGTIPCPECGGKEGQFACLACGNKGTLPCPSCSPPPENCDRCKATSELPCPLCKGTGTTRSFCPACGSRGGSHCEPCHGTGRVACGTCRGSGLQEVAAGGRNSNVLVLCAGCNGQGSISCAGCRGAGIIPCATCAAAQGAHEAACPMCAGKKTVRCPRCLVTFSFTGKDPRSGATVTVVPCREFEPMISAWIKAHLGQDRTAWRVIVDTRQATGALTFGGPTGSSIEATVPNANPEPLKHIHPFGEATLDDRFGNWLSLHGFRDFHARESIVVDRGGVRTLVFLSVVEKPAELRIVDGPVESAAQRTVLSGKNIGFDDWERACMEGEGVGKK